MYTIKAVKSFTGREGLGFNSKLYRDGKLIGTVSDMAHGGMLDFNLNQGEKELLEAHCKILPKYVRDWCPEGMDVTPDCFVTDLADVFLQRRKFKNKCRKKILFRLKSNKEGEFYIIDMPYSAVMKKSIEDKYGDDLVEIINETVK